MSDPLNNVQGDRAQEQDDVLIVEDSCVYAKHFQDIFTEWKYSFSIIRDGDLAWESLQKRRPKILLLDWNLPGMDGIEICKNLRERTTDQYVFIIMLTANDQLEDVVKGFEAGADDYIIKPFEPSVLKAKVKVGLRISELEQSNERKLKLLAQANTEQEALIQRLKEKNQIIIQRTEELRETQKQLVETARRAGMAEIATSVLHNVGNLLNTAMTAGTMIHEVVSASKLVTLDRLSKLLQSEAQRFPEFVAADPRGAKLPEFIIRLNDALAEERGSIQTRLRNLAESHEQIRQIIALQQGYAGLSGVKELVSVPELIADVTQLFVDSLKRHEINIACDYSPGLPEISIEKHKALQILVNLIQNARDATKVNESARREIVIRAREVPEKKVLIEVTDNGMGIRPENLNRIFNFGFTTKDDGHGFGLHGCANLAREMGGAVSVHSDGEGKGATFALLLPINVPMDKN